MDPSLFLTSVENSEIGGASYREEMEFQFSLKFSLFLLILLINFLIILCNIFHEMFVLSAKAQLTKFQYRPTKRLLNLSPHLVFLWLLMA
jgi:hypothetical protein